MGSVQWSHTRRVSGIICMTGCFDPSPYYHFLSNGLGVCSPVECIFLLAFGVHHMQIAYFHFSSCLVSIAARWTIGESVNLLFLSSPTCVSQLILSPITNA